ncbi:pterin-4-alpha-carbinolamine dehydratase [Steroidobacter denitrificans]|uniref:Putative pterin-4-alpha-carbinolamine dehydratase n=1 Tax=Steroidobacter denitrificans TaxID=465721 RepID=A0A127FAR0_STEDE|nr:pterin-4-alpha-carbinolamine dehydratase [Steroidobacter denitrificans]
MTCELGGKHCVPCEGGIPPLTPEQATSLMQQLDSKWNLIQDASGLRAEWKFRDFYRTMSFVNAIAHVANTEDHHPDLEIGYDYCRVVLTTHAIQGLSENDFICAAKIDALPRT